MLNWIKKKPSLEELKIQEEMKRKQKWESYKAYQKAQKVLTQEIISLAKESFTGQAQFKEQMEIVLNSNQRSFHGNWAYRPNHHEEFAYFPAGIVTKVSLSSELLCEQVENFLEDNFHELGEERCRLTLQEKLNKGSLQKLLYFEATVDFFNENLRVRYAIPEHFLLDAADDEVKEVSRLALKKRTLEALISENKILLEEVYNKIENFSAAS